MRCLDGSEKRSVCAGVYHTPPENSLMRPLRLGCGPSYALNCRGSVPRMLVSSIINLDLELECEGTLLICALKTAVVLLIRPKSIS